MKTILDDDLSYLIYSIVEEIHVRICCNLWSLIGKPKNSRLVGKALKMAFRYGDFPCHRVVNHQGRITPGWPEQVDLLKEEGVTFKNEFCVDLKKHQWNI